MSVVPVVAVNPAGEGTPEAREAPDLAVPTVRDRAVLEREVRDRRASVLPASTIEADNRPLVAPALAARAPIDRVPFVRRKNDDASRRRPARVRDRSRRYEPGRILRKWSLPVRELYRRVPDRDRRRYRVRVRHRRHRSRHRVTRRITRLSRRKRPRFAVKRNIIADCRRTREYQIPSH